MERYEDVPEKLELDWKGLDKEAIALYARAISAGIYLLYKGTIPYESIRYDDSIRKAFVTETEKYSSIPEINIEDALILALPREFGTGKSDVDPKVEKMLKEEKGMSDENIEYLKELCQLKREYALKAFQAQVDKLKITRESNPVNYRQLEMDILEVEIFPFAQIKGKYLPQPKKTKWKSDRTIFSISTRLPDVNEHYLTKLCYIEACSEFLGLELEDIVDMSKLIYFSFIITEEAKLLLFISHS